MLLTNTGWLISTMISIVFVILYPIVLAIVAHRRLQVSWRYFGYGALIFFLFQLITRIPLVLWLQNLLAPQLRASAVLNLAWIVILALTAGLTEEIGRYLGYRWFMKREEKTWNKAVMYGLGHGGFESMVFVGGLLLLTVVNVLFLSFTGINTLPESQRAVVEQQFATINAAPVWTPLAAAWERLWTVPFHVSASVLVLQVFQRKRLFWLWLAVLWHTLVDFIAVGLALWLGSGLLTTLLAEAWVTVVGLFSLWLIWRLRREEIPLSVPADEVVAPDTASSDVTGTSQLEQGE
jgi:uncharacterized membrane protein YhfC